MKRPFVYIGASMFISFFVFSYLGIYSAAAVFGVAAVLFIVLFPFGKRSGVVKAVLLCCAALIFSSSVFTVKTLSVYKSVSAFCDNNEHKISGTLEKYEADYGRYYYTLKNVSADGIETDAKILINSPLFISADIDDIVSVRVSSVYKLGSTQKSGLNRMADGVYLGAYFSGDLKVQKNENHSVAYYLDFMRRTITSELNKGMGKTAASVADAVLTGNKANLDYDTELNFRYSGISHLFAVSGFHLALWTSLIGAAFSNMKGKRKKTGNVLILIFIVFFMALTGFSKSVVRAGIMLMISVISRFTKFRADSLNSLFTAVTLILSINPFAAGSISLQMSFLATLGIITLVDPITVPFNKFSGKIKSKPFKRILFYVYTGVAVSLAASLFTIPVSMFYFGYFSVLSPVSNILCLVPSQALMALSGIAVLISPLKFLSKPLCLICVYIAKYVIFITDKIGHMKHVIIDTSESFTSAALIVTLFIFFAVLLIFSDNDKILRRASVSAAASLLIISCASIAISEKSVKVTAADVGNGTSVVYRSSDINMIIGCGGGKYREYKLTGICDLISSRKFSLILIPDNTQTQSYYAYDVIKRYPFESAVLTDKNIPSYIDKFLPQNSVAANNCSVSIDGQTNLVYIDNEDISGARITYGAFACTVFFRPTVNTRAVPDDWLKGNLLITRKSIPNIDVSGFENIIVSTDSNVIYDNANIYSTNVSGNITYTLYESGKSAVKEEKHDYKQ